MAAVRGLGRGSGDRRRVSAPVAREIERRLGINVTSRLFLLSDALDELPERPFAEALDFGSEEGPQGAPHFPPIK